MPMFFDTQMLDGLRSLVRPDHNWALIYLCAAAFMLMVSPGLGFFSRRKLSWRTSLAVLVGVTALFSFLFFQLGRRGYDEVATTHTVAFARPVDGQT